MERKLSVEISTGIVFRTILIIIGLWFLYFVRDIIALVFISIVIVASMDPIVIWLQKRKIRRSVGVMLVYAFALAMMGVIVSFLVPPIVEQATDFAHNLPAYSARLDQTSQGINVFFKAQNIALSTQGLVQEASKQLSGFSDNIFSTTVGIFSEVVAFIIILVMAFYMAVNEDGIKKFIISLTPQKHRVYAASLTDRIKTKIGKWMLGQLFLMFVIFAMDFVGLYALKVPYALSLAIFSGLMEVIPYIGPIVAAIPAIIAGFLISPLVGLLVLVLYIIVQQLEGHIIVPQVMSKAVGLHPIAVILALLIGFELDGVLGAILAIPVATAISVFIGDLFEKPKTE